MDRGTWQAMVHRVTQSQTQLIMHAYLSVCVCVCVYSALGKWTVKRLSTMQETWVRSLGQEDPLEKEIAIHSGKSHGQRSLVGYSPWGRKELDTTERLHLT